MERLYAYESVYHVLKVLSDVHQHINRALSQLSDDTRDRRRKRARLSWQTTNLNGSTRLLRT